MFKRIIILIIILFFCLFVVTTVSAENVVNETNCLSYGEIDDLNIFSTSEENDLHLNYEENDDSLDNGDSEQNKPEQKVLPKIQEMEYMFKEEPGVVPHAISNVTYYANMDNVASKYYEDYKYFIDTVNNQQIHIEISNGFDGQISLDAIYPTSTDSYSSSEIKSCTISKTKNYLQSMYVYANDLKFGKYRLFIELLIGHNSRGDPLYYVLSTCDFEISSNININTNNVTKYYGDSKRFVAKFTKNNGNPISGKDVKITINNQEYIRTTDTTGEASIGLNLNSGEYTIITECDEEVDYSTAIIKNTVFANNFGKMFKNGTQYQGTFLDSQGKLLKNADVEFNINGVHYTRKTDNNGVAKMNINLNPGKYILTATNPVTKENRATTIKIFSTITENYDLTKFYKNNSQYSVRLLDDKGNPVGAGVNIEFNINGVFYTRTSDKNGYVKMNINLPPDTYIITANYNGLMASNKITVKSILTANDINMEYKDGTQFEAELIDGTGKPYDNQKITFNINGVFYTKYTDSEGVASLNINLPVGEYIITSSYNGFNTANKILINPNSNPNSNPNNTNEKTIYGYWDTGEPIYDLKTWENFRIYGKGDWPNYSSSSYSKENFVNNGEMILTIDRMGDNVVRYYGNYRIEAGTYKSSNFDISGKEWKHYGVYISVSNSKKSGTGLYQLIDKSYYISKFYSNLTGEWAWHDYEQGFAGYKNHKYEYANDNFVVTKVAVKIIDGLSDDGYSFYPTSNFAPDYDWRGTSRETAIANNMHYIQHTIDGEDCSAYITYDPINQCYHM